MQENPVCRGCLAVEGNFKFIHEFSTAQAYENLLGIPLLPSDRFPQHVCSYCHRTLHKFAEFKARCHKVLEVLHQAQLQGDEVTKEYSYTLTSSCPELKPRYIRTKTVTIDVLGTKHKKNSEPPPTRTRRSVKQESEPELVDLTEVQKEEILTDNEEDNNIYEDLNEPKYEDDIKLKDYLQIFVDDLKTEAEEKKVKKVKKEIKRKKEKVKEKIRKKYVRKKKQKKVTRSDKQIVMDYAKSAGFDIAFLTHSEQIQQIEEKKNEAGATGHNCRQCGKHFDARAALERHQKTYHVFRPDCFMCDICSCLFRKKRTLRGHLLNHSWIFFCKTCSFKTNQKTVLRKHQNYHEGKRYPCKYCEKVFDKTTSYFSHVRLKHAAELLWCEYCGEFFIGQKGVENHKLLTHNEAEEFPCVCSSCEKRFKSVAALERHGLVKGCSMSSCVQCGDAFTNEQLLKYHLVQRHFDNAAPDSYDCDHCTMRFYSHEALVRHACGRRALCPQCGEDFDLDDKLLDHMALRHHIFKCEECGKQFTNAVYFKRHYSLAHSGRARRPRGRQPMYGDLVRRHQMQHKKFPKMKETIRKWRVVGERGLVAEKLAADGSVVERNEARSVICEVCGKGFKSSTELKTHQRFHSNVNLFSCSHCSKGFKQRVQLQMHERVHTGERPYKCPECPKAFKTYQAYTRHYLVHSGLRKHVCQICEKSFQTSTATKMHIKTVHMKIPMPPRIRNRRYKE